MTETEFASGVDHDVHFLRINLEVSAEFLDYHLHRNGVNALAHLCPSVAHFDAAVFFEAYDSLGDFFKAVAETTVL